MRWTPQQDRAINERGESLIVSAAAGSGKTAVLANRVAEFIKNGGSCQRLLVVTFTRLAAREMKDRIISVLDAVEKPSDHIREQKLLLHSARISTIDSLFGDIVRGNFKDLDITPDFGIIDTVEYNYIKTKAMIEVTDEYRLTYKNGYEHLEKLFGGEINDDNLIKTIESVYGFMQSIPFGEKWAELCEVRYGNIDFWTDAVCDEILYVLDDYIAVYEDVLDAIPFKPNGMAIVEEEYHVLKNLRTNAYEKNWDGCCKASEYSFQKSPSCAKDSLIMQKYKLFRNEFKDFLASELFMINKKEALGDSEYLKGAVHCLFSMVKDYGDKIFGEMKKKGFFSFDAVSKLALTLMVSDYDPESGKYQLTELAENLSDDFDEILIDEYQDVNDLQDLFFSAISKNNCFCVGDVKQSIYRFRHANPKNFVKKRIAYKNIPLNKNFRSRSGVLDFSNFVFSQLFSTKVGDTEYDETEKLNPGAEYPKNEEPDVEVNYLSYLKNSEEDNSVVQARFVAREIKRIMSSGMTISGKSGTRLVDFGDFAILLRKFAGTLPIYERVFYEEDIPCYSKAGGSFLDSIEVNTVLAYLKVIDNPYDDTALFAVMYSRLYGFTSDKLASLRTDSSVGRKGRLYDALIELGENDPDFGAFISDLKRFRLRSVGFPVHTLIWDIFTRTSYLAKALALPLGNIKRDRLMSFYTFARTYGDRTGGGTLGGFIDFAEKTIESGKLSDAEALPGGNFVKILTIHSSKGLEFPVCIVPELEKKLDTKELADPVLIDEEFGIAADRFSDGFEYKQTTLMKELIKLRIKRFNMSESLRLLYVAFTRAREKLILVSPGNSITKANLEKASLISNGERIFTSQVNGASSFESLITATLCRHPDAADIHTDFSDVLSADFHVAVNVFDSAPESFNFQKSEESTVVKLKISESELDRRFSRNNVYTGKKIPLKVSVSELSDDSDAQNMYSAEYTYKEPLFISGKPLMGAGKGSAIHLYMQLCDLGKGVHSEAARMKDLGLLTSDQYDAVVSESYRIERFENSPLYARILSSKNIFREESFVSVISACEYDSDAPIGSTLLIQGSLDMLCEYDDGLVIVDYKTDKATEEELISRYEKQLRLYKLAVEKNFGRSVKKCIIWSFWLSKEIEIK